MIGLIPEIDWDPYEGWNRASIGFRSRKPYKPAIRAEDLLMPSGFGNLRMLGMCAVMAVAMTLLYVWTPLWLLNFFVPHSGAWYGGVLGGTVVVLTPVLYFLATHETRRDRELASKF